MAVVHTVAVRTVTPSSSQDRPGLIVVEFPAGTTDEQIEQFKQAWTGGPVAYRRIGASEAVRVTVRWFTPGGSLVGCDCRETVRGAELQTLLAAWSERPLPTWIYIKPIGGFDDGELATWIRADWDTIDSRRRMVNETLKELAGRMESLAASLFLPPSDPIEAARLEAARMAWLGAAGMVREGIADA